MLVKPPKNLHRSYPDTKISGLIYTVTIYKLHFSQQIYVEANAQFFA